MAERSAQFERTPGLTELQKREHELEEVSARIADERKAARVPPIELDGLRCGNAPPFKVGPDPKRAHERLILEFVMPTLSGLGVLALRRIVRPPPTLMLTRSWTLPSTL
jgi:hypothetical protein